MEGRRVVDGRRRRRGKRIEGGLGPDNVPLTEGRFVKMNY